MVTSMVKGWAHPGDFMWLPCDWDFRARLRDRHEKISAHAAPTIAVLSSNSKKNSHAEQRVCHVSALHHETATCSGTAWGHQLDSDIIQILFRWCSVCTPVTSESIGASRHFQGPGKIQRVRVAVQPGAPVKNAKKRSTSTCYVTNAFSLGPPLHLTNRQPDTSDTVGNKFSRLAAVIISYPSYSIVGYCRYNENL